MEKENRLLLELKGINKHFPGVHALKDVDFSMRAGEVCAILGENGAGKSTLMNVLGGIFPCDSGSILIEGKKVDIRNAKDAEKLGIAFVHQELSLFKKLDIATNVFIHHLPRKSAFLNRTEMNRRTEEILARIHLDKYRPGEIVENLKIGEQQLVEIGRMLSSPIKLLILDEPTSSLTHKEIEVLFHIVRELKAQGTGVIFITHRLDEIYEICESLMIMRDGKCVLKSDVQGIEKQEIIRQMLGRDLAEQYNRERHCIGEELLSVKGLTGNRKLNDVSFNVHRGELVGLYGLLGSGRTEVLRCIFGLDGYEAGDVRYKGAPVHFRTPRDAIARKIAFVTEDRHKEGLVLARSVAFNCTLANLKAIQKRCFVDSKAETRIGQKSVDSLHIKTTSLTKEVQFLSGGNQQKVVLGKWINTRPELLLLDEPTRGIDVGAKKEIYDIIHSLLAEGMGVIIASSELPELVMLCDKVIVMKEGTVAGCFEDETDITSENLLKVAMGGE